jgi:manganese/iron transport system ATP-binding protein
VLAYGPTSEIFTQANLERTFGGVLRHFVLGHADSETPHPFGLFTDDERPLVMHGGKAVPRETKAAGDEAN